MGGQQRFDAFDARFGLLQLGQLLAQLRNRVAQQLGIVVDEKDGAQRNCAYLPEIGPQAKGDHRAHGKDTGIGHPHRIAGQIGFGADRQPLAQHGIEALHHIRGCPIGAQIFGRPQVFTQEAIKLGIDLPLFFPEGRGKFTDAHEQQQAANPKEGQRQPNAPIFAIEQHEHADHQEHAAQNVDGKTGEEVGKFVHIAVDPFD